MSTRSNTRPHEQLLQQYQWCPAEGAELDNFLRWLWPLLRKEIDQLLLAGDAKLRSSKAKFARQLLEASPYTWAGFGGKLGAERLIMLVLVACCQHLPNASKAGEQEFLLAVAVELRLRKQRQAAKPPRADKGRKRLKLV